MTDCVWISQLGQELSEKFLILKQGFTNIIKELLLTESEYTNIAALHLDLQRQTQEEFHDIQHYIHKYG